MNKQLAGFGNRDLIPSGTTAAYHHLEDERSRFLYEKRVLWSLTGDDRYIDDIICSMISVSQADEMIAFARTVSDRLAIRGIGNEFWTLRHYYPDLKYDVIVDRDPVKLAKGTCDGHRIISTEEFYSYTDDYYTIIASSAYHKDIAEEMRSHGIPEDHILDFGALLSTEGQYFEKGIIAPVVHEVFIDGGCYDGNTFRRFIDWCGGAYDAIYAFEPDHHNFETDQSKSWIASSNGSPAI